MRIGLIGWYGHDNAGDERILYCLQRFFEGHHLVATRGFDDAMARLDELNRCDYVLLGGGGLILRGTGRYAELIERLTPGLGCVGISVEALHADNRSMIDALKERAEFILVRDLRSRELLGCHFKTIVGPDLTFLYPHEVTPVVEADVCGLNLRPWRFWAGEHSGRFDRLMCRISNRVASLESHYPLAKWEPEKAVALLRRSFDTLIPIPLYFEEGVKNDLDALGRFFPEAGLSGDRFPECRFLVSMRLHGLIFACQRGLPFVSLSYQPKNEEFCAQLELPELSASLLDPAALEQALDRVRSGHAEIRSRLIEVSADWHREITAIIRAIRRLVVTPR